LRGEIKNQNAVDQTIEIIEWYLEMNPDTPILLR
jgi:hypothetical protein